MTMWINENCRAMPFPLNHANMEIGRAVPEYVRKLFALAREVRVLVVLEPVVVPLRIGGVKRYTVLAPFSVIVCDPLHSVLEGWYTLAEGLWANVGMLKPYTKSTPCGLAKALRLPLKVDEVAEAPYLCIDTPIIDKEVYGIVSRGGFVEIAKRSRMSKGRVTVALSKNPLHVFIKRLVDIVSEDEFGRVIHYEGIAVDRSVRVYVENVALIDGDSIAVKIGKGYAFSANLDTEAVNVLYHLLLLITYTTEVSASPPS